MMFGYHGLHFAAIFASLLIGCTTTDARNYTRASRKHRRLNLIIDEVLPFETNGVNFTLTNFVSNTDDNTIHVAQLTPSVTGSPKIVCTLDCQNTGAFLVRYYVNLTSPVDYSDFTGSFATACGLTGDITVTGITNVYLMVADSTGITNGRLNCVRTFTPQPTPQPTPAPTDCNGNAQTIYLRVMEGMSQIANVFGGFF